MLGSTVLSLSTDFSIEIGNDDLRKPCYFLAKIFALAIMGRHLIKIMFAQLHPQGFYSSYVNDK